jgi:hypothetical protein
MKYIINITSNSSLGRTYETNSRSAMKAAEQYGRYEFGEVIWVTNKSGRILSAVRYDSADGYIRVTV